jgi:hypothetical protein
MLCNSIEPAGRQLLKQCFTFLIVECLSGKVERRRYRQREAAAIGNRPQTVDVDWSCYTSNALEHVDHLQEPIKLMPDRAV